MRAALGTTAGRRFIAAFGHDVKTAFGADPGPCRLGHAEHFEPGFAKHTIIGGVVDDNAYQCHDAYDRQNTDQLEFFHRNSPPSCLWPAHQTACKFGSTTTYASE